MTIRETASCFLLAMAGASLLASCAPAPEAVRCRRVDVASMGPENSFRTRVAGDAQTRIAEPGGRIDVAVTSGAPLSGPLTLVQSIDGREVSRWDLAAPPSTATVHRCSLGFAKSADSCGAAIAGPSLSISGEWAILPNDNRILEASISFRVCD